MKFLFWNLNKKEALKEVVDVIYTEEPDIIGLVETADIFVNSVIDELEEFCGD